MDQKNSEGAPQDSEVDKSSPMSSTISPEPIDSAPPPAYTFRRRRLCGCLTFNPHRFSTTTSRRFIIGIFAIALAAGISVLVVMAITSKPPSETALSSLPNAYTVEAKWNIGIPKKWLYVLTPKEAGGLVGGERVSTGEVRDAPLSWYKFKAYLIETVTATGNSSTISNNTTEKLTATVWLDRLSIRKFKVDFENMQRDPSKDHDYIIQEDVLSGFQLKRQFQIIDAANDEVLAKTSMFWYWGDKIEFTREKDGIVGAVMDKSFSGITLKWDVFVKESVGFPNAMPVLVAAITRWAESND
ncbi:hypothetical protein HK102_007494 [Quaeritorhiza haematococci]|nr:hypothetical protein HK102_007494 [Quaeritorhiza haematococci]